MIENFLKHFYQQCKSLNLQINHQNIPITTSHQTAFPYIFLNFLETQDFMHKKTFILSIEGYSKQTGFFEISKIEEIFSQIQPWYNDTIEFYKIQNAKFSFVDNIQTVSLKTQIDIYRYPYNNNNNKIQ